MPVAGSAGADKVWLKRQLGIVRTWRPAMSEIVCEDCDPAVTPPLWEDGQMFKDKPTQHASENLAGAPC
jgi:hypothetical protein